jgi:hypothetical protein
MFASFSYTSRDAYNGCLTLFSNEEAAHRGLIIFRPTKPETYARPVANSALVRTNIPADNPSLKHETLEELFEALHVEERDPVCDRWSYVGACALVNPQSKAKIIVTDDYQYFLALLRAARRTQSPAYSRVDAYVSLDYSDLAIWPHLPRIGFFEDVRRRLTEAASEKGSIVSVNDSWSMCDMSDQALSDSWDMMSVEADSAEDNQDAPPRPDAVHDFKPLPEPSNRLSYLEIARRGVSHTPIYTPQAVSSRKPWTPAFVVCSQRELRRTHAEAQRIEAMQEDLEARLRLEELGDDMDYSVQAVKSAGAVAVMNCAVANAAYRTMLLSGRRNTSLKTHRSIK